MTKAEAQVTNLFDQGVQTFGEALKAGVKMQEEAARWWSDALDQQGPVGEFQKQSKALVAEVLPVAQKSTEEWMKVWEQNYRRGLDLVRQAWNPGGAAAAATTATGGADAAQARGQQVWESSMRLVRDSTQAAAAANVHMMEAWAGVLKKAANGHAAVTEAATERAAKAGKK